jgi:hypothetical protein
VAGALAGHGAYGAILARASWFSYFAVLGLSEATVESRSLFSIVGGAEIALGLIVLVFPVPALLLFIAAWKIFTELLRTAAGEPFWEFVERASNMIAPLELLYVRGRPVSHDDVHLEAGHDNGLGLHRHGAARCLAWLLPWLDVFALSSTIAYALQVAVAPRPIRATPTPVSTSLGKPLVQTAALAALEPCCPPTSLRYQHRSQLPGALRHSRGGCHSSITQFRPIGRAVLNAAIKTWGRCQSEPSERHFFVVSGR